MSLSTNRYLLLLGLLIPGLCFSQTPENSAQDSIHKLLRLSTEAIQGHEYNSAIEYSLNLISLAKKYNETYYLYHGYNNLGYTYYDLNDSIKAKDSYERALEYALLEENDSLLWWAYNNLGNIYSENEKTREIGFKYYDKVIQISERLENPEVKLTPLINIGWTHLDMENYDEALPYLEKADSLAHQIEDVSIESQLAMLFGRYYSGKDEFAHARCYFEKSVTMAKADSLHHVSSEAYQEYAGMLFRNQNYEEAYEALEKHLEYRNMIYEEEKLEQMEAAYTKFQTNQYRENLEIVQREQAYKDEVIAKSEQISIIMIISLVVMFLFLLLLYRNNGIRNKLIGQLREKNDELVKAKEKAEELSMLKSRFFSTVSHELRTPLYGVVGLTSLLLEDNTNKKQEEDLKSLKFSADYLLALINDVLQMNKMEARLVHLENTPFNIQDLIKGIVKSFEFSRHQNQNTIELQIDEEIPEKLIGDSVRLSQIIMNLLGNAMKFTERGKVWITARCEHCESGKCHIYFEIGDTGMGIPVNKQKEIFEEFSQLKANNYNYQGTGLGLPIVKNLLDLFGSEIKLESKEGEGSVFSFEILFEKGEVEQKGAPTTSMVGATKHDGLRKALIVDDNRINQVVTRRILEKRDFLCEVASDGYEAIEILKSEDFGLVLMDVNMPGMSGMETTQKIREFNKNIPIIALTAVEIQEMRDEILASGMNDIIIKPYEIPTFFNTIFRNMLAPAS